jgi:hypothetical protein
MGSSRIVVALAVLALGCGGASASTSPPVDAHEAAATDTTTSTASDVDLPAFVSAMCGRAHELAVDRARSSSARLEDMGEWMRAPEHEAGTRALEERVAASTDDAGMPRPITEVVAEIVPGTDCSGLLRLSELAATRDEDIDPALAASVQSDVVRMCTIAGELTGLRPEELSFELGHRFDRELTNRALRDEIVALAARDPRERWPALEAWAREQLGDASWTCPAMAAMFSE